MKIEDSQCLVIKIGSALLVNPENGTIHRQSLNNLLTEVAELKAKGKQVVLVSSGAIALGKGLLNLKDTNIALEKKQALAAIGQIELMSTYQQGLSTLNLKAAQVLLTLEDTEHRKRFINMRNTIRNLLHMNVVPIINENDSVATSEIKYGDNDRLAARVAQMIGADTLILLSDIDGLYSDDPNKNSDAEFIPLVENLNNQVLAMGKPASTSYGTGGMISKLQAATIAVNSGCHLLITAGQPEKPLAHFQKTGRGTWFKASSTPQSAKKMWLREHLKSPGSVCVDAGAVTALQKGASLLPVGIKQVRGQFEKGAAISVLDAEGILVARGLVNYTSSELIEILGKNSEQIKSILGYEGSDEVLHRDNLVLLQELSND